VLKLDNPLDPRSMRGGTVIVRVLKNLIFQKHTVYIYRN
jgi:hypothetical protein